MIKLKTIADLLDFKTDDLTTEFDDSKDIFFKTTDEDHIEILKIDHARSIIFVSSNLNDTFDISIELKNNKRDGRLIFWSEWMDYEEFEDGFLNGYSECAFEQILTERGFFKNGLKEGWWEYGDKYHDLLFYENRGDFHSIENYRPAYLRFYIKGINISEYWTLDSQYEYQEAIKNESEKSVTYNSYIKGQEFWRNSWKESTEKWMRDAIESGGTYFGKVQNYISYETYLKITNLPKLKPPINETYARSIDYDQILKEYNKLRTMKKVSRNSFKSEPVQLWRD